MTNFKFYDQYPFTKFWAIDLRFKGILHLVKEEKDELISIHT